MAFNIKNGCVLLFSHQVSLALPSPIEGLTSEFGMDSGVSPLLTTHPNWIYLKNSSLSIAKQNKIEADPY